MTWRKVTIAERGKGVCDHCGESSDNLLIDQSGKICADCAEDISTQMHADYLSEVQRPKVPAER